MAWRVARSLDVLLDEINTSAPGRSKVSDGSIGDAAHASRDSDHNPFIKLNGVGIVRARDFTHDPAGGLDCNTLAPRLIALIGVHPALRSGGYVIWQRRIWSYDRRSEGWRAYSGSNPHDHHLHLSVATAASGFDSTAPWGVMTEKDWFDMATKEDLRAVVREELTNKDNLKVMAKAFQAAVWARVMTVAGKKHSASTLLKDTYQRVTGGGN